jgi:hypothetical protein
MIAGFFAPAAKINGSRLSPSTRPTPRRLWTALTPRERKSLNIEKLPRNVSREGILFLERLQVPVVYSGGKRLLYAAFT